MESSPSKLELCSCVACPECGGDLVERKSRGKGRGGRTFYGCSNYPTCDFAVNRRPVPQPCPECNGLLLGSGRTNVSCNACEYKGPMPESEPVEQAV